MRRGTRSDFPASVEQASHESSVWPSVGGRLSIPMIGTVESKVDQVAHSDVVDSLVLVVENFFMGNVIVVDRNGATGRQAERQLRGNA